MVATEFREGDDVVGIEGVRMGSGRCWGTVRHPGVWREILEYGGQCWDRVEDVGIGSKRCVSREREREKKREMLG